MTEIDVIDEDEVYDLEPEIVAHYADPAEDVYGYVHIGVKAGEIDATMIAQDACGDVEIALCAPAIRNMIAALERALKVVEANDVDA
jgi:hypothetical protein